MKVDRLKLECDRLRQKSEAETMAVEKESDAKIDEVLRCRKQLDAEIESFNVLIKQQQRLFLRMARQEQARMAGKYR